MNSDNFTESLCPHPGDPVSVSFDVFLWDSPYAVSPHGFESTMIPSGSCGTVIASKESERLVLFQGGFGWTSLHNLSQF